MDPVRIYCAPIRREPFEYNGRELQVNRIARCPLDDLYALLTWVDKGPVLKKNGKPRVHQPPPHRDKSAEFYHAQCIHYGIKPYKTRPAAKKALLGGFASHAGRLLVPQSINDIETELKQEFVKANEAAKNQHEADKLGQQNILRQKQMKRKREEKGLIQEVSAASAKRVKQNALDMGAISGTYTVAAPYLSKNYGSSDDDAYTIDLAILEKQTNTIYGKFDFGTFMGYLRSKSINKDARTIKFHWRGRETGEGESSFGDDNIMQLEFLDDNSFSGYAQGDCFRRCKVHGKRGAGTSGGKNSSAAASAWKYQYESLDEDNYERERVARWH